MEPSVYLILLSHHASGPCTKFFRVDPPSTDKPRRWGAMNKTKVTSLTSMCSAPTITLSEDYRSEIMPATRRNVAFDSKGTRCSAFALAAR
jgi:hypothetical protein